MNKLYSPCNFATAIWAALSIDVSNGILCSVNIFWPSSSLVPVNLITTGMSDSCSLVTLTTAFATSSARVIPPKTFRKITLTFGFLSTNLKALVITSSDAPPPTSRNVAGFSP